jgi:hypothetical protein
MTGASAGDLPDLPRVECVICRLVGDAPEPALVAGPGDELALLIEIQPGREVRSAPSELVVELDRGEQVRARLRQWVDWSAGPARVALRLRWGAGRRVSSRLTCRVSLDGRPVGRETVLLMPGGVDAQGRFAAGEAGPASEATRLAYEHAWQALLDGDTHDGSGKNGP